MAETTKTADLAEKLASSIEDELGELDAILAELDGVDSVSDVLSPASTKAVADTSSPQPDEEIETITIDSGPTQAKVKAEADAAQKANTETPTNAVEQPVESVAKEEPDEAAELIAGMDQEAATAEEEADSEPTQAQDVEAVSAGTDEEETVEAESVDQEAAEEADETIVESESEAKGKPDDVVKTPLFTSLRSKLSNAACAVASTFIEALAIFDAPFSHFPLRLKRVVGYVAIATLLMAITTWVLADFVG